MWVRSQDKTRLLKVEDARIGYNYVCSEIWANNNCILGTYSTKEKALKVLDMIETHLEHLEYEVSGREIIFQMPADEEVKE